MDIVRERRRKIPKSVYIGTSVVALALLAVWAVISLTATGSGGVAVDKSTLVTDVARRGNLVLAVRAQGVFAPERVRVTSASQPGIVNQILVKPGNVVAPGSVIAVMQNPQLEAAVEQQRAALQVAQANLVSVQEQARAAILIQQSAYSDAQAQMAEDRLQAQATAALHTHGQISDNEYERAQIQATKSTNDLRISRAQIAAISADMQGKIAAAQAQVRETEALLAADQTEVDSLTVRAVTGGIVQSVDVDPGASIAQNTEIARMTDMHDLKAVLQVADRDVHNIALGMLAQIDTGNGVVGGRVTRIAPSAQNGTVSVDVTFRRPPSDSRLDANVSGTIEIASIPDAVSIARPSGANDDTTVQLFKEVDNGSRAVRIQARLGRGSGDRVQILSGIDQGDVVIVSDMSANLNQAKITLK